MEREKAAALAAENMKTIFAWSLARVRHREDAEDLAGDIIAAILESAPRLRDEDAFFGYIWAIASNRYKKFLRSRSQAVCAPLDDNLPDDGEELVQRLIDGEELHRLRCELSLLSREYRECTVAYYIDGKSCAEVSRTMGISLEMVKYYLFKTRKLLKEGFGMEREFGEKSYRPAKFEFVTIFSGRYNAEYRSLFNRRLPGNILLSAYHTPMTVRELSIELGVASAYMEDEVALLEKYRLLTPVAGGRWQTSLVIFTQAFTEEFYRTAEKFAVSEVGEILHRTREKLPQLRQIGFIGRDIDGSRMLWALLWLLMHTASCRQESVFENDRIYDGAAGTNYGIDYDEYNGEYSCSAFAGYAGMGNDCRWAASFADFGVLPEKNRYSNQWARVKAASESGEYLALTSAQRDAVISLLALEIEAMQLLYGRLSECASALMKVHAPKAVTGQVDSIVSRTIFFRTAGLMGVCAVRSGELALPEDERPAAIYLYECMQETGIKDKKV